MWLRNDCWGFSNRISYITTYISAKLSIATSLPLVSSSNRCLKCSIFKKSGKHSCCARGGAWFKNCGDADDIQFDHTWAEGTKACKILSSPVLVKGSQQATLRDMVGILVIANPLNVTRSRNNTQQRMQVSRAGSMSNISKFADCVVGLGEVGLCIMFILFFNLQLQMQSHFIYRFASMQVKKNHWYMMPRIPGRH